MLIGEPGRRAFAVKASGSRALVYWFSLLWILSAGGLVQADSTIPILTRSIRVVDPAGKPVAGAFAVPYSVNENYFWPDRNIPRAAIKTNAAGLAEVRYPQIADFGSEKVSVESVSLSVCHADFRESEIVVPVGKNDEKPFEIRLQPGIALTLSAVDDSGRPVSEPFAVAITRASFYSRWNRPTPAQAQARSIQPGNHQIMLFQSRPDGRHRFSEVLSYHFDAEKEPEVTLDEIELHTGIAVQGRLEDRVPRPIKNGFVVAAHLPLPLGNTHEDQLPSLIFYTSADIQADGTFRLASLPPTGTLQLIALCDGWVGLKREGSSFIEGQSFDIDQETALELKMERTFDAKIRVLDQAGQPVSGVALVTTPNQLYRKAGSNLLGNRFDSAAMLASQLTDQPIVPRLDLSRFLAVSDTAGRLTIRNLPKTRHSTSFECWSSKDADVIIKPNEAVEGKLPSDNQDEVEFDIKVEVVQRQTIAPSKK